MLKSLLVDRDQLAALMQRALEPAGRLSLAFVRVLGDGILQLLLVAFIVFFYYRDGDAHRRDAEAARPIGCPAG